MLGFILGAALLQAAPASSLPAWTIATPAAGSWTYRSIPGGSEASFAGVGGNLFTLRCTLGSRTMQFLRAGVVPGAGVIVRTTTLERSLPTSWTVGARDPLLDAIAFSRGRWSVEAAGLPPLILPSWPEAARSIEDCRN